MMVVSEPKTKKSYHSNAVPAAEATTTVFRPGSARVSAASVIDRSPRVVRRLCGRLSGDASGPGRARKGPEAKQAKARQRGDADGPSSTDPRVGGKRGRDALRWRRADV